MHTYTVKKKTYVNIAIYIQSMCLQKTFQIISVKYCVKR